MISVVIPAYNEQDAIRYTVEEARKVLEDGGYSDFEIIIVNDGSSDRTAEEAEAAGARVVTNPHNMGYGFSLTEMISMPGQQLKLTSPSQAWAVLLRAAMPAKVSQLLRAKALLLKAKKLLLSPLLNNFSEISITNGNPLGLPFLCYSAFSFFGLSSDFSNASPMTWTTPHSSTATT